MDDEIIPSELEYGPKTRNATNLDTAIWPNPKVGPPYLGAATAPSVESVLFQDIIVECAPEDTSSPSLQSIQMLVMGLKDSIRRSPVLAKTSPTTWKYHEIVELHPDVDELIFLVRLAGVSGLCYVTLGRKDIMVNSEASDEQEAKRQVEPTAGIPSLWLKFAVGKDHQSRFQFPLRPMRGAGPLFGGLEIPTSHLVTPPIAAPKTSEAPGTASANHKLGILYAARFMQGGDVADIAQAIEYHQTSVSLTSEGDADLPSRLVSLGTSFRRRFDRVGDTVDIDKAIEHQLRALQLTPEIHEDLPRWLNELGSSFSSRFRQKSDQEDLVKAIQRYQRAVSLTPEGHVDMSTRLDNLGTSFFSRFAHTGDLVDINSAIKFQQTALRLTPENHVSMSRRLNNLGNAFSTRFEQSGDLADIDNAIELREKAILLMPEGHASIPLLLNNLGVSFSARFERDGDLASIAKAIEQQQKSILLTPEGHALMPSRLGGLGLSLMRRFEHAGDLSDITYAIEHHQRAVLLIPESHPDLLGHLSNLAIALRSRYEREGNLADLADTIRHQEKALLLTPEGQADIHITLNNLGISLRRLFERDGDVHHLTRSIEHLQRAVSAIPSSHALLPLYLSGLGNSFLARFERLGDPIDITRAIETQQQSVLLAPLDHAHMPGRLNNLSISFRRRFERAGDLADLAEAIEHEQKAVLLSPTGHAEVPVYLNGLGSLLCLRFGRSGDLTDLSKAIENQKRAVEFTSEGDAKLPLYLNNLGISFRQRFEQTGNPDDIAIALQHQQKAVMLTPEGHSDLPSRLNSLGTSMSFCSSSLEASHLADISKAIEYQHRAVSLTPVGHSNIPRWLNHLGLSFRFRFAQTGNLSDLTEAIQQWQRAIELIPEGHAFLSTPLANLGETFSIRFKRSGALADGRAAILNFHLAATQTSAHPTTRLLAARRWASCSIEMEDQAEALEAYTVAIELLPFVASMDQTIQNRHSNLIDISDVTAEAVVTAFAAGNTNRVLEWLEQGRCLVWSQLNQLRTPVDLLRTCDESLADRFTAVANALESSGSRPKSILTTEMPLSQQLKVEQEAHAHVKLAQDWTQLLVDIRNLPNFTEFLRPPKAANILSQLPTDGPIIIINLHSSRCDALLLVQGSNEPLHVPLKKFTYEKAEQLRISLRMHLVTKGLRMRDDRGIRRRAPDTAKSHPIRQILRELWVGVVWPILESLGYSSSSRHSTRPHIRWCATGPLAFLPIHAAGIYGQDDRPSGSCLSDFAVSSYIPTVSILLEKLKNSTNIERPATQVLLVSQPNTPGLPEIPATTEETQIVFKGMTENGIEATLLESREVTTTRVGEEIKSHGWVHFACHACQDSADPLRSGFFFEDGRLELFDLIRLHIPTAHFAFLSACQTSVGDEKLAEEAIHLAAGMLAAGYQGVVATMWSIKDDSAPNIAAEFYGFLLKDRNDTDIGLDGHRAAFALDHATRAMRDKFGDEENALLQWVPYIHFGL